MDTKASVVLGDYSREGKARGLEAVRALDHDLATKAKLVPVGILEVASGQLELALASSHKTSDLLADTLEGWWQRRGPVLGHVKELVLNADNGPESNGKRSQGPVGALRRPQRPARASGVLPALKYNAVAGVRWSATGMHPALHGADANDDLEGPPVVHLTDKLYQKGVRLVGKAKQALEARLQRSPCRGMTSSSTHSQDSCQFP